MDLNRPLPPLPQPSHFDLDQEGHSDYHRQNHCTPPARPRDVFDYADDAYTSNTPAPASSPSSSSSAAMAKFGRRLARRIERACCLCATYFPLAFVYALTSWAVIVVVHLATTPAHAANVSWVGPWCAVVAVALDVLLIWSYTTAVVSSPGSTTNDQGYSTIPASLSGGGSNCNGNFPLGASSLTVKSNGEMRFCKKCQARKPDRAHHCSSCRRCVLKMDHHCPWLANCIGLRNGKAFLLFLIYTSLLSLFTFVVCGAWVWTEVVNDATYSTADESFMPVQYIMLCVIGGIIGVVVGLFTCWHLFLACRGQTTIECMEKTRYSSPLRSSMTFTAATTMAEAINDSLGGGGTGTASHKKKRGKPLHDEERALFDGVEGAHDGAYNDDDDDDDYDDDSNNGSHMAHGGRLGPNSNGSYNNSNNNSYSNQRTPPTIGRRLTYNELERYRAQKRHEAYMDEQDNQKLPHAFDLGVRRNLLHMFGPRLWLWPFPILTTTGDGWTWEPSPKWLAVRDRIKQERDAQLARERAAGWGAVGDELEGVQGSRPRSPPPPMPIIVTTAATPPRPRPTPLGLPSSRQQPARDQPSRYRRPGGAATTTAAPPTMTTTTTTTTKADRILGRTPGQYADAQAGGQNGQAAPLNNKGNNVSLQRLNAAGRTLPSSDKDLFADEEEEDEVDSDEEVKPTPPPKPAATPASQSTRPTSPLRARWLPDRTSGLLRKASPSPAQSPVAEGPAGVSPLAAAGGWRGTSQPAESVASDADDGSVD